MPGIGGILIRYSSETDVKKISDILNSMMHEPFYRKGTYSNIEAGFFVCYLAIEKSFADCMPIFNEKKDIVLFFTGECYDDPGDIHQLRAQGHYFQTGNASYLVHKYEELGDRFFSELNGWFNGLLLDLRDSKAILFNDRYGIRRLYVYEHPDFIAFASEAKALLIAFPELREISPISIGEFLTYDCVLQNRTYFPKIELLPPGSVWIFKKNYLEKKVYHDVAELESLPKLNLDQFTKELEGTFKQILPRYFKGGPIGLSLTGGLDTRIILACINPEPGQLPCYTFCGTYKDIIDIKLAPKVAAICGQSHQRLTLDDQKLIQEYPKQVEICTYISDGLEGVDKADVINFNRMARAIAPVRMTGKYGSQVLKGIFGFKPRPLNLDIISIDFQQYVNLAQSTAHEFKQCHPLTFLLQGAIPWWWNSFITLETSQIEVRSPFLDNDLIKILYRAPSLKSDYGVRFELQMIARNKPELLKIPTTGTHGGKGLWPIPQIKKSYLKMMMLLDKAYNTERLPANMTHLMARADKLFITPLCIDRVLFGAVEFRRYRRWFRDELSGYIRETLLCERTLSRPYWNRKNLIRIVNDHLKGRGNYLREIRRVLQIELIHRVLLNG